MGFIENSDLDKSQNLSDDDFVKAFSLDTNLARAIKYIVQYSQHKNAIAGNKNLQKAIDELQIELNFNNSIK